MTIKNYYKVLACKNQNYGRGFGKRIKYFLVSTISNETLLTFSFRGTGRLTMKQSKIMPMRQQRQNIYYIRLK